MRNLHLKSGLRVSGIISVFVAIPQLIRFESTNLVSTFITFCYAYVFSFSIWIICEYFLTLKCVSKGYKKVLMAVVIGTIFSVLLQLFGNYFFHSMAIETTRIYAALNLSKQQQMLMSLFRGFTFTGLIYFVAYYISLTEEKQKNQLEIEQLKQENLEARLSLLKQQVSPHFLFNSLSTLKTIAKESETKNYIIQLSNVYRYLLNDKGYQNNNLVSLKEELAFTQSYLYILSERFEDALQVRIQVEDKLMSKRLPPLALQILIENAIKHNIVSIEEPLQITISTEKDKFLVVENKLQPKLSTEDSLGMGLQNIKDRYKLLEDKDIEIIKTEALFTVKIPLLN